MSKEREDDIWKNCIFIFDSSALLNFYYFTDETKNNIFSKIFENYKGRLWIPQHVEFEYLKKRKDTLTKLINDKYKKFENLEEIKKSITKIENQLTEFNNNIKNDKEEKTHPIINIDNKITDEFHNKFNEFESCFAEYREKVNQEIDKRKSEIEAIFEKDILLESIEKYFSVGEKFSFDELMKILPEGEFRYKFEIPPGYKDYADERKKGTQKIGDLIIWKQIINYAKETPKPIILVIDDLKDDWCYVEKRSNEKRIERPREELIKEIKDIADVSFWMYSLTQFISKANALLKENGMDEKSIEEINEVSKQQYNEEPKRLSCNYPDMTKVSGKIRGRILDPSSYPRMLPKIGKEILDPNREMLRLAEQQEKMLGPHHEMMRFAEQQEKTIGSHREIMKLAEEWERLSSSHSEMMRLAEEQEKIIVHHREMMRLAEQEKMLEAIRLEAQQEKMLEAIRLEAQQEKMLGSHREW
jgi:hypothetical protein